MSSDSILLEGKHLIKRFGGLTAIGNVSFQVPRGCIKAIIGPNGAGKTTIFNLVMGNYPLDGGEIYFEKRVLNGMKPHQIAHLGISRTFQNVRLFGKMSVIENIMVGIKGLFLNFLRFSSCCLANPPPWSPIPHINTAFLRPNFLEARA